MLHLEPHAPGMRAISGSKRFVVIQEACLMSILCRAGADGMLDAAVSRLEASDEFQLPAYQDALGVPSFVQNISQRCVLINRSSTLRILRSSICNLLAAGQLWSILSGLSCQC